MSNGIGKINSSVHTCGKIISTDNISTEERRNRILRVKYGATLPESSTNDGKKTLNKSVSAPCQGFVIVGQTMIMHYAGILPHIINPLEEKKRNWILRIRYGPPWISTRSKSELTPSHLHVKGKVMNQFVRLPSIASQGFDGSSNSRRHHPSFGLFHSQLEPLQGMRNSSDNFHIDSAKIDMPQCAAGARNDAAEKKTERTIERRYTNASDMISTVYDNRQRNRNWSDIDEVFYKESSSQIKSKQTSNKIEREQKVDQNKEEKDNCENSEVTKPPCQFTRKKTNMSENRIVIGKTTKSTPIVIPRAIDNETRDKSLGKSLPAEQAKTLTETNSNQRKSSTTTFLSKPVKFSFTDHVPKQLLRKTSVMMPSANGTTSKSNCGLPSGQTSSSKLQRRYSKSGKFDLKPERKKSESGKTKKIPPKPESPPGPSEEEMQELQMPVIRKFLKMPPSRPKVVCFDFPGVNLTHNDVKRAIENVVTDAFEQGKVVSVQFENINVKLATGGKDNRWFVELKDFSTRNILIKKGLTLECANKSNSTTDLSVKASSEACTSTESKETEQVAEKDPYGPRKVDVRLYDSVSMEEYKLFLRRTAAEEKLQNVILLCAGRGDKLLTNML